MTTPQVNADSREEHSEWLRVLDQPSDFLVFSPNVHEIRGYNRLAGLAKGDVLLLLQVHLSTLGNIQSTLGNIQSTLGNIQSTIGNI